VFETGCQEGIVLKVRCHGIREGGARGCAKVSKAAADACGATWAAGPGRAAAGRLRQRNWS